MAFFRQRMQQTPGFAGGSLEEQLARAAQAQQGQMPPSFRGQTGANNPDPFMRNPNTLLDNPNPQILTSANREAITRPRAVDRAASSMREMVAQQAQQPIAQPSVNPEQNPLPMRAMTPETGIQLTNQEETRPKRTQMRDFIADDSAYLRDVENQPRNWKDKTVDVIRGLNAHFNPGSGPGMPTKREREIARAQGTLGRDVAVEKQRTDSALKELIPIKLDDGTEVMVPARAAGALQSQQQKIRQGAETLKARKDQWATMNKRDRVKSALAIYNSGGANNPETLAAISDALDLPADLKPKFVAGEIAVQPNENGEVQLISKRDGSVVNTGVKTYETTKEEGRNIRQERAATAAMARTQALIAAGIGKLGDPDVTENAAAELQDQIDDAKEAAEKATADGFPSQATKHLERADKLQKTKTDLEEAANKARAARSTAGTTAPKAGRTIEGAVKAFTKKMGRPPTPEEKAKMQAAL